ncbi:MAG: Tar ligand binding domain-containing protein [Burkholderiaceae bacterium]|nr:Tar ligand binding domain-containing protein [Burkholderiaceae bacterium]
MKTLLPRGAPLRNITIRKMILCVLLLISGLIVALSAISSRSLHAAGASMDTSHTLLREVSVLSKANDQLLRARIRLDQQGDAMQSAAGANVRANTSSIDEAMERASRNFADFVDYAALHDAGDKVQTLQTAFDALIGQGLRPARDFLDRGDLSGYRTHSAQTLPTLSLRFSTAIEEYEDYAEVYGSGVMAAAAEQRIVSIVAIGAVLLTCLIVIFLTDRYVVHYLRRPLENVRSHFKHIANGDLTAPIVPFGTNCVGQLIPYLSEMQTSLVRTVRQVRIGVERVNEGAAEIAQGSTELSARTEQQAAVLEQVAASMEQMAATVRQNADSADQANVLAKDASHVAHRGGEAMAQVESCMGEIGDVSRRIAEIVGVIDSIAFQTNILALNAAVEAARAGEQGKGFAVVAAEVRSLAQRSAGAAKEIKTLIDESSRRVQAGSQQVDLAGQTVRELLQSVGRVNGMIAEISAASREQSTGIEQVNQAVTQMDENTQANAAMDEARDRRFTKKVNPV